MNDIVDDPNMNPRDVAEPLRRAIGDRYLTYALSTIMNRALPDARDGLKPVHRRILYAMRRLRLSSNGGFLKSAKISGDTMGDFHPHGDAAIYDAMARLAQDFTIRYPLVDGQGNFGNIDGDNPAASRYTEARMTIMAEALLDGLDENSVDFRPNYDGRLEEPSVLPASYPNLLANGSSGIDAATLNVLPDLEIVCSFSAGYEKVDVEAARSRGIAVTHGPGVNAASAADHAIGLMIACGRGITWRDRHVRDGGQRRHAVASGERTGQPAGRYADHYAQLAARRPRHRVARQRTPRADLRRPAKPVFRPGRARAGP